MSDSWDVFSPLIRPLRGAGERQSAKSTSVDTRQRGEGGPEAASECELRVGAWLSWVGVCTLCRATKRTCSMTT